MRLICFTGNWALLGGRLGLTTLVGISAGNSGLIGLSSLNILASKAKQ